MSRLSWTSCLWGQHQSLKTFLDFQLFIIQNMYTSCIFSSKWKHAKHFSKKIVYCAVSVEYIQLFSFGSTHDINLWHNQPKTHTQTHIFITGAATQQPPGMTSLYSILHTAGVKCTHLKTCILRSDVKYTQNISSTYLVNWKCEMIMCTLWAPNPSMSGKLTNKYFQPWSIHQLQDNQVVTSTKKRSLPGVKCDKHSINIRLKHLSNLDIRYFTLGGAFRLYFYKVSL